MTNQVNIKFNPPVKLNKLTIGRKINNVVTAKLSSMIQSDSSGALLIFKNELEESDKKLIAEALGGTLKVPLK